MIHETEDASQEVNSSDTTYSPPSSGPTLEDYSRKRYPNLVICLPTNNIINDLIANPCDYDRNSKPTYHLGEKIGEDVRQVTAVIPRTYSRIISSIAATLPAELEKKARSNQAIIYRCIEQSIDLIEEQVNDLRKTRAQLNRGAIDLDAIQIGVVLDLLDKVPVPKTNEKLQRTTVYVPDSLHERIKTLAGNLGCGLGDVVNLCILSTFAFQDDEVYNLEWRAECAREHAKFTKILAAFTEFAELLHGAVV